MENIAAINKPPLLKKDGTPDGRMWRRSSLSFKERCAIYYQRTKGRNQDKELLQRYNLTPERFLEIAMGQDFVCAICRRLQSCVDRKWKELAVDHDHTCCPGNSCGKCVRGLLCDACNLALGTFSTQELLVAAIEYLRKAAPGGNTKPI